MNLKLYEKECIGKLLEGLVFLQFSPLFMSVQKKVTANKMTNKWIVGTYLMGMERRKEAIVPIRE